MKTNRMKMHVFAGMAVCGMMIAALGVSAAAEERTLKVAQDGSGDYVTIQEAANEAQPGDIILVSGGVYREEVVLPQGGTDDEHRITLKAADGEEVIVTGSELTANEDWILDEESGLYVLTLEKEYFSENAEGEYFNPFAVNWMSKGGQYENFFSCGCVYVNGTVMAQKWSVEETAGAAGSWFAQVDEQTGETKIYANFGEADPADAATQIEINNRMQCVTAAWNQGYITIDGITVMHGCGPKTIDFWMTTAEAMYGAIATNGGYHWVIENCTATQNRGVAIDFGNGSGKQENKYGGEPELYGYHLIKGCNVSDNGTNGMMAYRGAYTEICDCVLSNNNALNTGLLSEAYIKDVSGGWGIRIHDNYLYSDQDGAARPIWLDCECDGSVIERNVICDTNNGFTYVDLECNAGWLLVANNVLVSTGWGQVLESHSYLVNNLFLMNGQEANTAWNSGSSTAMPGAEGFDGYSRAMRITEPGTLNMIGKEATSRFETFNRFNKLMGNVMFDFGVTQAAGWGGDLTMAVSSADFNDAYTEVYLNPDPAANKDYSGGCWKNPELNEKYAGILAWIPVEGDETLGTGSMVYGNECDYNVYCGGAKPMEGSYSEDYTADENSVVSEGSSYTFEATPESFTLTLTLDAAAAGAKVPLFTGETLGAATLYEQQGYAFMAPDVAEDYFGNARGEETAAGPFATLTEGENSFVLWPRS